MRRDETTLAWFMSMQPVYYFKYIRVLLINNQSILSNAVVFLQHS
jgi:hypothetical protein